MGQHTKTEVLVGLFVMLGIAALGYLSISIGGLQLIGPKRYTVMARFASIGDLKVGAPIRLAGVKVGEVKAVHLRDYVAEANLAIERSIQLPTDTIASIRSQGLLGDVYISLSPGGSLKNLKEGELIAQTEPAVDLTDLLARYAFGKSSRPAEGEPGDGGDGNEVFSNPLR